MVRSNESGSSAENAAPITTVGSTNAAVISPSSSRRPANRNRANTYAGARPTTSVSAVLHDRLPEREPRRPRHVRRRPSMSPTSSNGRRPCASSVTNGHT